jgi:RNA polymerase sigma-70 factor (ECF subfamily)
MHAGMEDRQTRRGRQEAGPPQWGTLDLTRRSRYLALLRRWTHERLPAGTRVAADAAEWMRNALAHSAICDEAACEDGLLVRLRARLLADRPQALLARTAGISPRVEQLIGCDRLAAWEAALAALPRRQREIVILRIEFGLDFAAIGEETGLSPGAARAATVNALAALIDALRGTTYGRAA